MYARRAGSSLPQRKEPPMTSATNPSLDSALAYAGLNYRVFPVWGVRDGKCLCNGKPNCRPGKHPWGVMVPHGEKDATTDSALIAEWFPTPAVNVGISISGFHVA